MIEALTHVAIVGFVFAVIGIVVIGASKDDDDVPPGGMV